MSGRQLEANWLKTRTAYRKKVLNRMCAEYHVCNGEFTDPQECEEELARRLTYELHYGYVILNPANNVTACCVQAAIF
jgi:hypothetical protein